MARKPPIRVGRLRAGSEEDRVKRESRRARSSRRSMQVCALPSCDERIPQLAADHRDGFCSTRCCRRAHGLGARTEVEFEPSEEELTEGAAAG